MTPRFNVFFRWFARRFFGPIGLDDDTVARLRALEERGSVVYVMRYASRLDYFLFNALFLRHGLRLSGFANGIRFDYYRPLWESLRIRFGRRGRRHDAADSELRSRAGALVQAGQSVFLFLRTARLRLAWRSRRRAAAANREEFDFLTEIVRVAWNDDRPIFLVPLALFWRKGPRAARRFLNLTYGAPTRPSDLAKVAAFLTTYRNLFVKVGDPIDLGEFVKSRRSEGEETLVRKLRRTILVFLYREEKVVEGPTLWPRHKVQEYVLADPRVGAAIAEHAFDRGVSVEIARDEAERMFRELAAHMNSTFLAVLNAAVGWIFRRVFVSVETTGLERVVECARRHPIVLLPSHRSYFDFLILSWLFYGNHLVPPHIAARENMAFGPFGFLFRRAGAFFLRRSFDDPLYKAVFRAYVAYLVKEGFPQEFFIEGGRSRIGRTLAPRLGMLSWEVEAFSSGARRDLFLVPIAVTYERLVEEGAMLAELEGARKRDESMLGLVRARKVLRRRWGSAYVNFGEPISLADAMGERRARFAAGTGPEAVAERRCYVEQLAELVVERINWCTVATATAVAACAFLGETRRGMLRRDLVGRMQALVSLLRVVGVPLTPELERDEKDFRESIRFLVRNDLIRALPDPRGEILYFEEGRRRALDLYRNTILHYVAAPSILARRLLARAALPELRRDYGFWVEFLYLEFFPPRARMLGPEFELLLEYFERSEAAECREGVWSGTEKGRPALRSLAEQTRGLLESYHAVLAALAEAEGRGTARQLRRAADEWIRRGTLLGEVVRAEAANPIALGNALDVLARRGLLEATRGDGEREVHYVPGPAFGDLAQLRERVATALAAR